VLGTRALEQLPRDRALDGIHAFNDMRYVLLLYPSFFSEVIFITSDHLLEYLRPFAQQGKIVEEADVTRFFATLKEKRHHVN
jgi:E3 ubiquitin-protein ligase UBR7